MALLISRWVVGCVALTDFARLSGPQCSHLQDGDNTLTLDRVPVFLHTLSLGSILITQCIHSRLTLCLACFDIQDRLCCGLSGSCFSEPLLASVPQCPLSYQQGWLQDPTFPRFPPDLTFADTRITQLLSKATWAGMVQWP